MNERAQRALPDDVADLLAREREAPVPAGVEDRLLARVQRTVAAPAARPEPSPAPAAGPSKLIVAVIASALMAVGGATYHHVTSRDEPDPQLLQRLAAADEPSPPRVVRWRSAGAEPAALPVPAVAPVDTLAAERAVLDRAQDAILAGDGGAALAAVAEHARRFQGGLLVEERDALRVQALVVAGRVDEARRRGRQFLARYPRSIQRGAVEAALESTP